MVIVAFVQTLFPSLASQALMRLASWQVGHYWITPATDKKCSRWQVIKVFRVQDPEFQPPALTVSPLAWHFILLKIPFILSRNWNGEIVALLRWLCSFGQNGNFLFTMYFDCTDQEWEIMHAPLKDHVDIDGVHLRLSEPQPSVGDWIGQSEILKQLLACWLVGSLACLLLCLFVC